MRSRAFPDLCLTTAGASIAYPQKTVPVFVACNASDPDQAFLTYPAVIATPSIGTNQLMFDVGRRRS